MNKRLTSVVAIATIGVSGLTLIKSSEGLRTSTYLDPAGIPTVCYGHTGPDVRMGQKETPSGCERLLLRDIAAHQVALVGPKNCIASAPLTGNQRDAVTSLTFNIGVARFCRSTMARHLKARDYIGAADEFPKWRYARVGGRNVVLPGLVTRRAAERRLFLTFTPMHDKDGLQAPISASVRAILR